MSVKLQPAPKCESPAAFRGHLVKKLKIGLDLHCDTPLQPLLELKPDQDQVSAIIIELIYSNVDSIDKIFLFFFSFPVGF